MDEYTHKVDHGTSDKDIGYRTASEPDRRRRVKE
jgi:hypothetical protein